MNIPERKFNHQIIGTVFSLILILTHDHLLECLMCLFVIVQLAFYFLSTLVSISNTFPWTQIPLFSFYNVIIPRAQSLCILSTSVPLSATSTRDSQLSSPPVRHALGTVCLYSYPSRLLHTKCLKFSLCKKELRLYHKLFLLSYI